MQETSLHPVILVEPYITGARMETKVLDNGSAYTRVKSQDGRHFVQFLTVRKNHERNRGTLGNDDKPDFRSGLSRRGATIVRMTGNPPTLVK